MKTKTVEKELVDLLSNTTKTKAQKKLKTIIESVRFEPIPEAFEIIKNKVKECGFIVEKLEYDKKTTITGVLIYKIKEGVMGSFDFEVVW